MKKYKSKSVLVIWIWYKGRNKSMSDVHSEGTYNLPAGYNDNYIILLAKDPHWLFAYWEVSDEKKNSFIREFGHEFLERSVPVLKITNVSKDTNFFVRINDFSNNWYINVDDPDSMYVAELGRRVSDHFFISLANSNYVITPGNSVSPNTAAYFINYNDLRNGKLDIQTGNIYETYDLKTQSKGVFGISSPELFGINIHELVSGISSAELSGARITEYLGISSESLIK